MKYVKRLILLLMIVWGGTLFLTRTPATRFLGEASETLNAYYNVKKADEINSRGILIYIDEQDIKMAEEHRPYVNDSLEVFSPSKGLNRLFNCSVVKTGDQTLEIRRDDKVIELFGGDYDPVNETVRLETVARGFGYGYTWDMSSGKVIMDQPSSMVWPLPEDYDLRKEGRAPSVGNQGIYGTCWAFAALSAMESTLLPEENQFFAVDHMSILNGFDMSHNEGGDFNMALSYFARWAGPVPGENDPYGDLQTDETLRPAKHLQEARMIGEKDYETIKRMVYTHGGVQSSFYSTLENEYSNSNEYNPYTSAYYYAGTNEPNHDVVIVGWDDNYPKSNFNSQPKNNGAFICQNSWGKAFGESGYFYISYEDSNIGVNNIVYTRIDGPDNYDSIYQSDKLGWVGAIGYNEDSAYFANVFEAEKNEVLSAVSFYATDAGTYYDIYYVKNYKGTDSFADKQYIASGYFQEKGYYTVDLGMDVDLSEGERFAVVVEVKTKDSVHPVAIEYAAGDISSNADITDGEGYISYNGLQWVSAEFDYRCNVCLKAFTKIKG